jgi:hypothetical protein
MRQHRARLVTASALALAVGIGVPATLATSASAATSSGTVVPVKASAAQGSLTSTAKGTFTNADGAGTFAGTFTPTAFKVAGNVLEATGTLKGTMTDANGSSLGNVSQTVTLPVKTSAAAASARPAALGCNVLSLVLGPLNLNLLGLVVTLNQVNLNITAVPGELLGTLLCDVAGLLNGGGALTGLSALLNEILGLL